MRPNTGFDGGGKRGVGSANNNIKNNKKFLYMQ
jgi:hypothetical protein